MKQPSTTPIVSPFPVATRAWRRARRLLWLVCLLLVVTVVLGRNWDAVWHATHVFETFYSPPHLFILSMTGVAALVVIALVCSPSLRSCFGSGFRVPLVPFEVPGALFLLASGFVVLGFAGLVLDNLWHTAFGLDETAWSVPHAMMGWALLLVLLGCVACRLALGRQRALPWYTASVLGFLILSFSASPFLGPLNKNNTPEIVQAIASIPVFKAQQLAQHTFRIYQLWGIDRTNPLLVPLGALWAGVALTLVRRLTRRSPMFLAVVLAWSLLVALAEYQTVRWLDSFKPISSDPAAWLPFPLLPTSLGLIGAIRVGFSTTWAWVIAGAIFGVLMFLIWGTSPRGLLISLFTAPLMLLGARVGEWIGQVLERPVKLDIKILVMLGVSMALVSGAVDLYLRMHTPYG